MEITRVGFGAWAIGGGGWEFGWGPQQDDESIAAIHRAMELGVNWIDTAAAYGFGQSEQVVGRALEGLDDRPYVFTKCSLLDDGTRRVRHSLKRDSVLREAEASLQRLGIDAIDLYQIHWPNPEEDIEEGWAALAELKEQGLVRHIGVSNFDVAQMRRIQSIAPVETLQPPYSLVDRGVEDGDPPVRRARGHRRHRLLADGLRPADRGDDARADRSRCRPTTGAPATRASPSRSCRANLALAARLRVVADRHGVTPGAVAVAWTLRNPAVDGAITGFRRPDQVDPVVAAANLELTAEDMNEIEAR